MNGITLQHRESRELDLPGLVRALGVEDVAVVNPMDLKATRAALKAAAQNADELSVIIFCSPCVLLSKTHEPALVVSSDCRACGACTLIGCPAISRDEDGKAISMPTCASAVSSALRRARSVALARRNRKGRK